MKRTLLVLVAVIAGAAVLSACGAGTDSDAATINSSGISRSSFQDELKTISENKQLAKELKKQNAFDLTPTSGGINTQLSTPWLNSMLNQTLVDKEFKRKKLKVSAKNLADAKTSAEATFLTAKIFHAFPKAFQNLVIQRGTRIEALKDSLPQPAPPSEAALMQLFEQTKTQYCPSNKLVSHILVKTKEEADAIEAQLAQGADFATLAKEKSTDTGSAPAGGILACTGSQQYDQFAADFRAGADATAVGTVSAPVQTQFGYHIIKADPWTFEVARPVLEQASASQQENPLTTYLNRLLLKAKIWVDPRYGTVQRTNQTVTVVAPKAPKPKSKPAVTTTTTTPSASAPATTAP